MNIFLRELQAYKKFTIIWSVALAGITVIFLLIYPAFAKDIDSSIKILENFPPAFRQALGISLENFFSIFGFYAYLLGFVVLTGAVQAMNVGIGIIAKEFSGKTADFLLSKPVSRTKVLAAKISTSLTILLITNVVFISVSLTTAKLVSTDSFSARTYILLSLDLFLVQLFFWALGTFIAVIIPKIRSIIALSLPIVFTFFIIGMLDSILGVEKVRYITPFKFYDLIYIIKNSALETKFLSIEGVFLLVMVLVSFIIFSKKDIHAAA